MKLLGKLLFALFFYNLVSPSVVVAQNKVGVNITDNFGAINQAVSLVNADGQSNGGWVVLMPKIGNCTDISNIVSAYQGKVNFIIRLHYPDTVPDDNYALSWASTLVKIAEQTSDVIYVYPWNEPNMPRECGGRADCTELVREHVAELRRHLEAYGLWQTKIRVLSPMVNQSGNLHPFVDTLGNDFFSQFAGQVMNLYDFQRETGGQACRHSNPVLNACSFEQVLNQIPGSQTPAYGVEIGIVDESGTCPQQVTDCPFFEDGRMLSFLQEAYDNHWFNNSNIAMAAPLFYNPEITSHPVWLWGSRSEQYLKSVARRRSGNTSQQSYSSTTANSIIQNLLTQGTLIQCENSCGLATSQDLCQAASGLTTNPGYDSSIFDDYNADPEEFYIQPIRGLIPTANRNPDSEELWGVSRQVSTIREDLIKQGYEAHCATPGFQIELNQNGQEWMDTFLKSANTPRGVVYGGEILYPSGSRWLSEGRPFRSTLTVDYRELFAPLFRDVSNKRFEMASIEEFFGYKDTSETASEAEIQSAPINSLVSNKQRCILSVGMLLKQKIMCEKLEDANSCALYSRPVPQTSFTIKTGLDLYLQTINQHQADFALENLTGNFEDKATIEFLCEELTANREPFQETDLKQLLLQVPLTMDRNYRLAFLVTSIEMKYPRGTASMFNFFEHPNAGFFQGGPSRPGHGILVTAFKVPDITTNKGIDLEDTQNGNTNWLDSSLLTRNSLLTQEQIGTVVEEDTKRTNDLLLEANEYQTTIQSSSDEIFCTYGAPTGVGPPECSDPLSKALTDIINAQANLSEASNTYDPLEIDCPDLEKEFTNNIGDPANFGNADLPSKLYSVGIGADLLNQLFIDSTHLLDKDNLKPDPQFAETWRDGDPEYETVNSWGGLRDWGLKNTFFVIPEMRAAGFPYCCEDAVKVKHFLVYPEGYNLKTIEAALAGSFFSQDQLASLTTESDDYDRFEAQGDVVTFEGAEFNKDFDDYSNEPPNTPVEGRAECEHEETYYDASIGEYRTRTFYALPCRRSFGFTIDQVGKNLHPGILGAKLGFWLRKIQQQLSMSTEVAWTYLDSCETTEQFFMGQCGQDVPVVEEQDPDDCTDLSCGAPPPEPTPTSPPPQVGCVRGERGREMCIIEGKLYIYDHNVDVAGDGTPDEHCGGHVTVNSSVPAGCTLVQQRMWGYSSPGGPLADNLGCVNLTQVTAMFDSTGGSCSQETLSVVAN